MTLRTSVVVVENSLPRITGFYTRLCAEFYTPEYNWWQHHGPITFRMTGKGQCPPVGSVEAPGDDFHFVWYVIIGRDANEWEKYTIQCVNTCNDKGLKCLNSQ